MPALEVAQAEQLARSEVMAAAQSWWLGGRQDVSGDQVRGGGDRIVAGV